MYSFNTLNKFKFKFKTLEYILKFEIKNKLESSLLKIKCV